MPLPDRDAAHSMLLSVEAGRIEILNGVDL